MNRQVLKFEPNSPLTVALEFPDGVNVQGFGGPQVKFSLTNLRLLYADPELAQGIRTLQVKPGEPFTITKRTERGKKPWWDLARVKSAGAGLKGGDASEYNPGQSREPVSGAARHSEPYQPIRAAIPPDSSTHPPKTQPEAVSAPTPALLPGDVKRIPPQVTREQPPPSGGMYLTKTPPLKPSYEDAFRECLRIVTEGLAGAREQWSDGAKQAMVSTLLIQLGRENRLGEFQTQQIGKVA